MGMSLATIGLDQSTGPAVIGMQGRLCPKWAGFESRGGGGCRSEIVSFRKVRKCLRRNVSGEESCKRWPDVSEEIVGHVYCTKINAKHSP